MRNFVKWLAHRLLGDYSIYVIFTESCGREHSAGLPAEPLLAFGPVTEVAIRGSSDSLIREQADYCGDDSSAFACLDGDRIVGICFYWYAERYRKRNFWPLRDRQAKLVQILTLPEMRGRGIASRLIKCSSQEMGKRGFSRLYARIWHSNAASVAAFERAGWTRVALVIEISPLGLRHRIQIPLARKRDHQNV